MVAIVEARSRPSPSCGMGLYYADTLNPRKAYAVAKHLNADVELVRRI